jgi:hypothetical protein
MYSCTFYGYGFAPSYKEIMSPIMCFLLLLIEGILFLAWIYLWLYKFQYYNIGFDGLNLADK